MMIIITINKTDFAVSEVTDFLNDTHRQRVKYLQIFLQYTLILLVFAF